MTQEPAELRAKIQKVLDRWTFLPTPKATKSIKASEVFAIAENASGTLELLYRAANNPIPKMNPDNPKEKLAFAENQVIKRGEEDIYVWLSANFAKKADIHSLIQKTAFLDKTQLLG
jgi:hypothetical protein